MDYNNYQHTILLSAAHKLLTNRSQWRRCLTCGSTAARLLGLRVRIWPGHGRLSFVN